MTKHYKIVIANSGKQDIKAMKSYILKQFKYRQFSEQFSTKMKFILKSLEFFPEGYHPTGLHYRGYHIFLKSSHTYLIFYTIDEILQTITVLRVMKDGMNWQYAIKRWIDAN